MNYRKPRLTFEFPACYSRRIADMHAFLKGATTGGSVKKDGEKSGTSGKEKRSRVQPWVEK